MTPSPLMQAYQRHPLRFTHGRGLRLWDADGVEYLDAIAGVAVTNLGHAHPEVAAVLAEQASRLLHVSNLFEIEWQEALGRRLAALSGLDNAFFANSGAEANEAAIKLARLHGHARGSARPLIVTLEGGFHGRTLATLSATASPAIQAGFAPLLDGFVHVPANDIAALEPWSGHPDVAAVLLETVQGEGGVRLLTPDYLRDVRELCDRRGWLLMVDEIQTGLGRTGRWFGYQHADIRPDVVTLAKALGNGFPIGACLAGGDAARLFTPGRHGSTFGGNPLACRVASEVLQISAREDLPGRAAVLGARLMEGLRTSLDGHPEIVDIRGRGLMAGIELSSPCPGLSERAIRDERLLVSVTRGNTVRLLPALIASEAEIDDIVARLARVLWAGR